MSENREGTIAFVEWLYGSGYYIGCYGYFVPLHRFRKDKKRYDAEDIVDEYMKFARREKNE